MWVIATYEASSLFTLKPASATSSGGKTLLVPTPFAIKMAVLDSACRLNGKVAGEQAWAWIMRIGVALQPATQVVVNNVFTRVLKKRRTPADPGSPDAGYYGRSIGYREYLYIHDEFRLALEIETSEQSEMLLWWLQGINYLGRRGSFIQLQNVPEIVESLPENAGFVRLDMPFLAQNTGFSLDGTLMLQLDDVGEGTNFERVNIYKKDNKAKLRLGEHRILRHVALNYRRVASSRSYTWYRHNTKA